MRQQLRFVRVLMAWFVVSVSLLAVFDAVSFELLFVVSFLGYLVVRELTAPVNRTSSWRQRLWPVTVLGVLGFAYFVALRLVAVLPSGWF
jgi:hypothetical protein